MKTRSRNFGLASGATSTLRTILNKFLPYPTNRGMQIRFTGAVAQWIGGREIKDILPETNIGPLADFQFNDMCRLQTRWKANLEVLNPAEGLLQLKVPAFTPLKSIMARKDTVSVTLQVSVAAVDLVTGIAGKDFSIGIEISYDDAETGPYLVDMPVNMERGTLIVTACSLQYNVKEKGKIVISDDPLYLPAAVVEGRYC